MYVRSNIKDYGAFNGKEERTPESEAGVRKQSQRTGFGGDARGVAAALSFGCDNKVLREKHK